MFKWLRSYLDGPATAVEELPEKRHTDRFETGAELSAKAGPSRWPAQVQDLSTSGVGLVMGMFHKAGSPLPLRLVNARSRFGRSVMARVVRTSRRADGHWFVGCAFEQQLNQEELESLI